MSWSSAFRAFWHREVADELNLKLVQIAAPLVDLLDLKGALSVQDGKAQFLPLNMWPKETDAPVLVLIDELPQAVPAIQNGFSQLLIDNQMSELTLPEGSMVVATGNRLEDKAATHRMPSHITNRVVHITLDTDHDSWLDWALENGVHPMIAGFAKWRPELLYTFDAATAHKPYATYRSWMQADALLKTNPPESLRYDLIRGVLGEDVAIEFSAFWKLYSKLPDIDQIFANPESADVPNETSTLYALASAMASKVGPKTYKPYFDYVNRMPTEFAVMSVKLAAKMNKGLTSCKPFTAWAIKHRDVIL